MPAPHSNGQPTHTADILALCQLYVGVQPTLVPEYDRLQVRLPERVQGRIDANNAPDYMVKRYARLMTESRFPPPLYTEDGVPVDGNTRTKAYAERATRWIEAYVLPIAWNTASAAVKEKLKLLSLALNAMNGLPLDEVELVKYAAGLIHEGANDEEIVGKTGLAMSKVTSLRDQQRAVERLTHLGLNPTGNIDDQKLPDTVLRAFGKSSAMRLDDEAYKSVVQLAKDAGLKGQAIGAIATSLNEAPTPELRRDRLAREKQALQPQILARQHGQQHPMLTDKLRRALDMLLANPVTSFVEGNLEKAADYVELLDKAIDKLAEVRALQLSQPAVAAQAHQATAPIQ